MTYDDLVATLANLIPIAADDANFGQILPATLDYAQNRIQNDLSLMAHEAAATVALTPGTRSATLPTPSGAGNGPIYIVESCNVVTPAGTAPDSGTRNSVQRTTVESLNYQWGSATDTALPVQFAMLNDTTALFGPFPDAAYIAEFIGVYNPPSLSSSTQETWISINMPELLIAACMIFLTGWMRDFGQQSDDPQAGQSWEAVYQALLAADAVQEARKRAGIPGWVPAQPQPAGPRQD